MVVHQHPWPRPPIYYLSLYFSIKKIIYIKHNIFPHMAIGRHPPTTLLSNMGLIPLLLPSYHPCTQHGLTTTFLSPSYHPPIQHGPPTPTLPQATPGPSTPPSPCPTSPPGRPPTPQTTGQPGDGLALVI